MDRSPLGRLPAELRTSICEYALCLNWDLEIAVGMPRDYVCVRFADSNTPKGAMLQSLALTMICRQAYAEARPIYFAINTWHVWTCGVLAKEGSVRGGKLLDGWLRGLGRDGARLFRDMAIYIPFSDDDDLTDVSPLVSFWDRLQTAKWHSLCVDLSRCFDTRRTRMSFKMRDISMARLKNGVLTDFEDIKVCFPMNSSLGQQLEAHKVHSKAGFADGKRHAGKDLTVDEVVMLEDEANEQYDWLRHFADCIEHHRRSQSAVSEA